MGHIGDFLRRVFNSPSKAGGEFDLEREAAAFAAKLPPCASRVVIASPRYSGNYRCEVTIGAAVLLSFVSNQTTIGGTRESRIAIAAFPLWLREAPPSGPNTSYLPEGFVRQVASYVGDFVVDGRAKVYCPDCRRDVDSVEMRNRNQDTRGPWSEFTEGWRCPAGHLLYTEDHEIHILRSSR